MICQLVQKKSSNMCLKCAKTAKNSTFCTKKRVTEKNGDLKICPPVGQIDHKNVKNMDKLLSNSFGQSIRRKPLMMNQKKSETKGKREQKFLSSTSN